MKTCIGVYVSYVSDARKKESQLGENVDKYTYHLVYLQMKASDNKKLLSLIIIIMVLEELGLKTD
jgi:hypothetical protein